MRETVTQFKQSDSIHGLTYLQQSTALTFGFGACLGILTLFASMTSVYGAAYVTGKTLGTVRNNYSGFVGMEITVGASPVTVSALGRFCVSGNSGTHLAKLVAAATGADVPGGSVSISMSGGTAGSFKYAALSSSVVLAANTSYYLVSEETSGSDTWYNNDTTVTTTAVATEVASVHGIQGAWTVSGTAGHSFVPVDFQYLLAGNWSLAGNAGTTAGPNFLGTTDNQPLELHVNGARALRLEPTVNDANHSGIVNVVNGSAVNTAGAGVYGATIGGGGAPNYFGFNYPNTVTADFGTVCGGLGNANSGFGATVCGGLLNTSSGDYATVGGGGGNTNSGFGATVGGGYGNTSSGSFATVGGGRGNTSSGEYATGGGGRGNTSSGEYATVGGGIGNLADGDYAMVPGGSGNNAHGANTFAAGTRAKAYSAGSFVWADSQNADFDPNIYGFYGDSFCVRASGGSVWITSTTGTKGPYFIPGDLGWRSSCDKNLKENFTSIDEDDLLEQLSRMPITKWNAKAQSTEIRHIGPTAQDFHAAFGLGGKDDKGISTIDEGGVALAAIQGLNQKVESENASLRAELKARDADIAELRRQVAELMKFVKTEGGLSGTKAASR